MLKIKLTTISLILALTAVNSVLISNILGGFVFLDFFVLALIPSFLLFLWSILSKLNKESKDYVVAFSLLIICICFAFFIKFNSFTIGTIDDDYHTGKIAAFSIDNSFQSKLGYVRAEKEFRNYFYDFIEIIWGTAYRFIRWDHIIVLIQSLPLILLWSKLVNFFRNKKLTTIPALLATSVILSLQIFWCQQGSTYIDSTVGILGGLTLLECYDLLAYKHQRTFYPILGLAITSALCVLSKLTMALVGFLGLSVSLFMAFKYLSRKNFFLILLFLTPMLGYLINHHYYAWSIEGHPFFPWMGTESSWFTSNNSFESKKMFDGYLHYHYTAYPTYTWLKDHGILFKPIYVLVSWLLEFKTYHYLTPDPWVGGNGSLMAYIVIPVLFMASLINIKKFFFIKQWINTRVLIFLVLAIYYYFFDGSIASRFMLSFHVFILAWCLAWLWKQIENIKGNAKKFIIAPAIGIILSLSVWSYLYANDGDIMNRKIIYTEQKNPKIRRSYSVINLQRNLYPQWIRPSAMQENLKLFVKFSAQQQ